MGLDYRDIQTGQTKKEIEKEQELQAQKDETALLNIQVIDLFEQLIIKGVL